MSAGSHPLLKSGNFRNRSILIDSKSALLCIPIPLSPLRLSFTNLASLAKRIKKVAHADAVLGLKL